MKGRGATRTGQASEGGYQERPGSFLVNRKMALWQQALSGIAIVE